MQNYTQTPSRIYDLYQYYMGGGKPNTPPVAPGPAVPFMSGGGGGGNMMMGGLGSPQMIGNFNQAIAQRQNRLNNPNKATLFAQSLGLPKQDSVQEMMARGMLGKKDKGMTLPGIFSMLAPDQYGNLTLGDQILTQSYMGFTDPNTGMANKDPFGINVRSAMGNYSEYANKQVGKLGDMLSGRLADKYGATWDEELGAYTGKNAKKANDMTKMLREKYGFYGKVKNKKQDIASDLGLIQKAIEADKKAKHEAARANLKTANKGITSVTGGEGGGGMTARERGAAASRMGGGSRQAKSGGQKAGGSGRTDGGWGWAKGGIVELLK